MVTTGLIWLAGSLVLFVLTLILVRAEQKRGARFLLGGVRGWLDGVAAAIGRSIVRVWDHFTRYVVQLGWYYGLHSFLRTVLRAVMSFYHRVESVFEINRRRTAQLRAEKSKVNGQNHLTEMAQHKVDTALTPAQERKMKEKQLKGD